MRVETLDALTALDPRALAALETAMAGAGVNTPRLDRERRVSVPVNVAPACLQCGSYYLNRVDARLSIASGGNGEVHGNDGYDWCGLYACEACGFVASGAAVTS